MKDHLLLQQDDLNRLRQQVKAAWAKLPDDVKAKLKSKILATHNYALSAMNKTASRLKRSTPSGTRHAAQPTVRRP